MTLLINHKISPNPSLLKRGIVPPFSKGRLGGIFQIIFSCFFVSVGSWRFPCRRESSLCKYFWIPAFAGMTIVNGEQLYLVGTDLVLMSCRLSGWWWLPQTGSPHTHHCNIQQTIFINSSSGALEKWGFSLQCTTVEKEKLKCRRY